jgi:hypothetical protein
VGRAISIFAIYHNKSTTTQQGQGLSVRVLVGLFPGFPISQPRLHNFLLLTRSNAPTSPQAPTHTPAHYMPARLCHHTRRRHQPVLGLLLLLGSIVFMVVGRLPGAAGFLLASCSSSSSSSSSSRASSLLLGASHRARVGSAITTTVQWHLSRYVQTYNEDRGKERCGERREASS